MIIPLPRKFLTIYDYGKTAKEETTTEIKKRGLVGM